MFEIGESISHLQINRAKDPILPFGALNYPVGIHIQDPLSPKQDPLLYVCDGGAMVVVFNAITGKPLRTISNKPDKGSFDFVTSYCFEAEPGQDTTLVFITNDVDNKVCLLRFHSYTCKFASNCSLV